MQNKSAQSINTINKQNIRRNVRNLGSIKQHRLSFLVGIDGNISHVFNKFKTKEHHQVVLDVLAELAE